MVAHRIAQVMEISPWEALLLPVRRAAAWAAFYDSKMSEANDDGDLAPGGDLYEWVLAAERVNEKLARWSKMAVDAGVQAMLVQQAQTEGMRIARVLNNALAMAGIGGDTEVLLREALARALMIEAGTTASLEGTIVDDDAV